MPHVWDERFHMPCTCASCRSAGCAGLCHLLKGRTFRVCHNRLPQQRVYCQYHDRWIDNIRHCHGTLLLQHRSYLATTISHCHLCLTTNTLPSSPISISRHNFEMASSSDLSSARKCLLSQPSPDPLPLMAFHRSNNPLHPLLTQREAPFPYVHPATVMPPTADEATLAVPPRTSVVMKVVTVRDFNAATSIYSNLAADSSSKTANVAAAI